MKAVALGECVFPVKTWNPAKSADDEEFNYIDISSVDQVSKAVRAMRAISCAEAPSRARQLVAAGDVLVSTVRPNLNAVAKLGQEHEGVTASTGFCVIRPNPYMLDGDYAFQWVKSPGFIGKMMALATGASYPAVSDKIILGSSIPLPPIADQRRIAAILDQADAVRSQRRKTLAELDKLVQAVFVEMFGDPVTNSLGLPLASLGSLGVWSSGGTPPRGIERYFTGSIPWFSSGELEPMYVATAAEYISDLAIRETSAKKVPAGAIMLGMYDTAALKASIASVECSCNQAIAFCQLNPALAEAAFVYSAIVIGREHFKRLQRGVRQKNLNLSMIRGIQIPLPQISRQQEFTKHLHSIEALKETQRLAITESDALFAALQQRAFAGLL